MHIGMVAGEPSGSILGAGLLHALHARKIDIHAAGVGGSDMLAAGFHSLYDIERLSVMGIVEPLCRLPELFKIRHGLYRYFVQNKPDVFVGIDSPDFNLGLEHKLHKTGIPVVHYVSPSVWAWRKKRIYKIAKAVDLVLTLFPFEAAFYEQHNVPVCFVGHPLADKIPLQPDQSAARLALGLEPDGTYIAVLPGSRRSEIHHMAERFITAAQYCWQENPTLKFITSAVNAARDQEFQATCKKLAPTLPLQFFTSRSHEVMAASDVVLVTSGTATLEAMLFKRPMVIAYCTSNLTYQIFRYLVDVPYIGLPNLLANQSLVPEFIQGAAQPKKLADAILDYLNHPEKVAALQEKFTMIHQQLCRNASDRAVEAVLNLLQSS